MVGCYCYHLHSLLKFCENFITKIISITPFVKYVLPTPYLISSLELVQRYKKVLNQSAWSVD